ncbi:MAG: type VI secretion system membrane subunit TssM [Gluconacetobacter diazotrophicus]|nr:type VI secretion system membrane subunit TssM [Gluconacetobacter diazotrophicus]
MNPGAVTSMETLGAVLLNRWTASFAGMAIACTIGWYLGPLIPGLQSELARALAILVLVLLWAGINGVISLRRRRRDRRLAEQVGDAGPADAVDRQGRTAEEVEQLRAQLARALNRLRRSRRGRGYLYEQPWFVLIGPPGSGKTTALLNSGLAFPLADEGEGAALRGVGGTRLCDWWFSDEAVLIDTAGRYTTQDSDEAVDRAGWLGFLDMLRRTRTRQPLNGIVVVVALTDIALAPPEEREAHARAIRRRIKEVTDRLGLRLPVYCVFSKADRLAGFTEFFDDLSAEERTQVWGTTFPLSKGVELFAAEFRALVARISERLLERMQAERSPDRRAAIVGFPMQLASLEEALSGFLGTVFGPSRLDPAPLMRGAYFTSATQEGTPVDRITAMLSRSFGIDQKRAPSLRPVRGRSYFLGQLVEKVILGEALLVSDDPARRRRRRLRRGVAFAAIAIVSLGLSAAILLTMQRQRVAMDRVAAAMDRYRDSTGGLDLDPVRSDELPPVLPALDAARALSNTEPPAGGGFLGLSQAPKLSEGNRLAYRDALDRIMLPRLLMRLEAQMRAGFDRPDFLYQATRVYLMLGGAGPLDPDLVRGWMRLDWAARYPGPLNQPLRDALGRHLDALLAVPLPAVPLDGGLVGGARATFSRTTLAQRVYSRLRPADTANASAADPAAAVPPWTPAGALGADAARFFRRPSGRGLDTGVDGFFTVRGFREQLLARLPAASRAAADESWVLGRDERIDPSGPAMQHLQDDVVALYAADYERAWDATLDDLVLAPLPPGQTTTQALYVLASPQSPIRDMLVSITAELAPTPAPSPTPGAPAGAAGPHSPPPAPGDTAASLAQAFGPTSGGIPAVPPPGAAIAQHFAALRAFTGDRGAGAPLSGVLRLISELQNELTRLAPDGGGTQAAIAANGDPAHLLAAEADRQPIPVSRWLKQIAAAGGAAVNGGAKGAASAAFNGADGAGDLCRQVVSNHFPFDPDAGTDAPLDDFVHLMAPGGALAGFYDAQVKPFVSEGQTWKASPVAGIAPPVTPASLASFQKAAVIRQNFFPTGTATLAVRFDVSFLSATPNTRPTLALGRTAIVAPAPPAAPQPAKRGAPPPPPPSPTLAAVPASVTWPGDDGMQLVRVSFDAAPAARAFPIEQRGPWALFRLLDLATVTSQGDGGDGGGGNYDVVFRSGTAEARYRFHAQSAHDPFGGPRLSDFRCPTV